ncbi:acyltransferase family protein [Cerasicoccus fimbriatus]|uniref:acyltransferase family protein n=1 Tax=Cerasicoccus fimbriatus TaxID=3014554 RepID=UPI0022B47DAC|nr:acyltransferase [Cerasicoccus sp. TK19100]
MRRHIPNLDGLRAFAILPVLGQHASYGLIGGGFLGVDLFFVLSGFLITGILFDELQNAHAIGYRNFYVRRALRLLPAMVISLLLAAALWPLTFSEGNHFALAATSVVFYFSNFVNPGALGSLESAWSLSLEEQFYLIWPLALALLFAQRKANVRQMMWLLVTVVALVAIGRIVALATFASPEWVYRFTLTRADSLIMGALAALFVRDGFQFKPAFRQIVVMISGVLFFCGVIWCSWQSPIMGNGGFTFSTFVFAAWIIALTQSPPLRPFSNRIFKWIGHRSYGLYIYHLPIFLALEHLRAHDDLANFLWVSLLRFGLTFLVADLSYRYIEQPVLKLKRLFPTLEKGQGRG